MYILLTVLCINFYSKNSNSEMEFCMTLKDIAEMAGVSTMTVSNVINKKTSRVSQKQEIKSIQL